MKRRYFAACFLVVVVGTFAGAGASEEETEGPEGFERERVYVVPVQPSEGPGFQVDRVVIDADGRRFGVSASAGVVRESQDRIRLRGVPVIGRVFMDRLSRSDLSPEKAVGGVYADDGALLVDLERGHRDLWFESVVLVHDRFSYRFQGELSAGAARPVSPARPIGRAFAREGTLMILVRPSIITDSVLDF